MVGGTHIAPSVAAVQTLLAQDQSEADHGDYFGSVVEWKFI